MQGQQPVLRQSDQQQLLQTTNFVIKMNEVIQPITPVGECYYKLFSFWRRFFFFKLEFQLWSPNYLCIQNRQIRH